MNKTDLIDVIAEHADISKVVAGRTLDVIINTITETLSKGDSVTLIGFGTFDVSQRKERSGRNPQTGAVINIPAAKAPRFKAGKNLKDKVNGK